MNDAQKVCMDEKENLHKIYHFSTFLVEQMLIFVDFFVVSDAEKQSMKFSEFWSDCSRIKRKFGCYSINARHISVLIILLYYFLFRLSCPRHSNSKTKASEKKRMRLKFTETI